MSEDARRLCIAITPFNTFLLTISFSSIIVTIPLISLGLKWSFKATSKLLKIVHWITSLMLLTAGIMFPLHQMLGMEFSKYCNDTYRINITVPMSSISFMLSLICISCLYLARLTLSFKNTKYALHKMTVIILALFLFVQSIFLLMTIYFTIEIWSDLTNSEIINSDTYIQHRHYMQTTSAVFAILNIAYLIVLLRIFVRKIFEMSKCIKDFELVTNHLIKPCIMYLICVSISIIAISTVFIFNIIRSICISDTNKVYMIHLTLITVVVLVNVWSVNIQFQSPKNILFNKCCKCCNIYLLGLVANKRENQRGQIEICTKSRALALALDAPNQLDSTTPNTSGHTTQDTSVSKPDILPQLQKSITTMGESDTIPIYIIP